MADVNWPGLTVEPVKDLLTGLTFNAGVSESRPSEAAGFPGQTTQRIMLLLPGEARLQPPTRLRVRGLVVRVLGTQMPPEPGGGTLVTCQLVNPDLPDIIMIFRKDTTFDRVTNKNVVVEVPIWTGDAHLISGDPRVGAVGGELAPASDVTVTIPGHVTADLDDAWLRVTSAVAPALRGLELKIAGEITDSTSPFRRLIARGKGVF